jgi:hypothetical protein
MRYALLRLRATGFGSTTAGGQPVEHDAPPAAQQFSVKYATSELMAAKSAA